MIVILLQCDSTYLEYNFKNNDFFSLWRGSEDNHKPNLDNPTSISLQSSATDQTTLPLCPPKMYSYSFFLKPVVQGRFVDEQVDE